MSKIWVKFGKNNATRVSTENCDIVDDFLEACKKKLPHLLGSYDSAQLSLSNTDGGTPLKPDDSIPAQNTANTPLLISVANGSTLQPLVPTLWRANGSIIGARKMGFRRRLYQTADDYLGFYEKRNGIKQDPFSYQDDGTLIINVIFENKDNALHFRSSVHRNINTVSPQGELALSVSVEQASDAVLDETILFGHYVHDDDSPPDTPGRLSVVTELYDTSPLFQYQRLERAALFGGRFKADKAHLIDKPYCEKGKQFAKFQDNENNFLALSKDVHCWFDGLVNCKEKVPYFKLLIKHVSSESDPANDDRYRVELIVEAYDNESARMFFPRLKDGSSVVGDLQAETFVYVKNPEEFRVCLSWKNDKIESLWNFTPAVE
jgi:hypothetical protein